jgi:hypothetical protein
MLGIAILLWANLPLDDGEQRRPKPLIAGIAGAVIGVSLYGYSAIRIFLPCFLVGLLIVNWSGWIRCLASRDGRVALVALAGAVTVLFGPLLWSHLNDPAISERARILGWIWQESDSIVVKVSKIITRYLDHYGLDFLFVTGDRDPALSPPKGFGLFHWYDLPLITVGIVMLARAFKASRAARVMWLWFALYPAGDILFPHVSSHSLRSLAGVGCLTLVSALGAVRTGNWLWRLQHKGLRFSLVSIVSAGILISNVYFIKEYFGADFARQKSSLIVFGADIFAAAKWLQPRLPQAAAVFVTGQAAHPDIVTLVGLNYDPQRWFGEARDLVRGPLPDGRFNDAYLYLRYGKIFFLLTESSFSALNQLSHNERPDRVIFIVRPGELGLERYASPVQEIRGPAGEKRLWIFDLNL